MANIKKKSFEEAANEMKRLMNFSVYESADKKNYTSEIVEYKKVAADGKCYGIVREGNTYYIKVSEKIENPLRENFDYIGGIGNKSTNANGSYHLALKNFEFKLRSINEAHDKKNRIIDSFNPDAKQIVIAEERVEMSNEISRLREIMFKTSGILKENLGYKPVMTTTGGKPDEKAEPFTDKVGAPKGTEVPSKGNIEPKKVGVPFNDETKPDMKADPSQAARKFKITGLQLKQVKAKLAEEAAFGQPTGETVTPAQTTPVVTEGIDESPYPEDKEFDSGSYREADTIIPAEAKKTLGNIYGSGLMRQIGNNEILGLIKNAPENMSPEDEYLYVDNILSIIGNLRLKHESTPALDRLATKLYDNILEYNPIYIEATRDPNGEEEFDIEPELYDDNEGFEDDDESLDLDGPNVFGESKEKMYEVDEDELVEAILNVWGKAANYGETPMTMPGEGTRQYDVKKPVGFDKGTTVAPAEKELVDEPKDANKEMTPVKDIEATKNYMDMDKIAESIIAGLKKKV